MEASSRRSPLAASTLKEMGYTNVMNYQDGFDAWREAGLPVDLLDEALGGGAEAVVAAQLVF